MEFALLSLLKSLVQGHDHRVAGGWVRTVIKKENAFPRVYAHVVGVERRKGRQ